MQNLSAQQLVFCFEFGVRKVKDIKILCVQSVNIEFRSRTYPFSFVLFAKVRQLDSFT